MRQHLLGAGILLSWLLHGSAPAVAQYQNNGGGMQGTHAATNPQAIAAWFASYDAIRRQAQMTPADRAKADAMMSQGLSMIIPGEEKAAAQSFLSNLVQKNSMAANKLKQLALYPETENLHRGYYKYFTDASQIFQDYITVQNNLFAVDAQGKALAGGLMNRKQALEALDMSNKNLDSQLRQQFGIPPYHY